MILRGFKFDSIACYSWFKIIIGDYRKEWIRLLSYNHITSSSYLKPIITVTFNSRYSETILSYNC